MKIELWPVERLKHYPQNPRRNDAAVEAVARSIDEFGWRVPIIVDQDGVIIAGDTRLKAAIKLGISQVPVHVAEGLSDAQIKAYRIADNQTASIAEWDTDLLKIEIGELKALEFDLTALGFDETALADMTGDFVLPADNKKIDENMLAETNTECPSCGFKWKQ